MKLEKRLWQGLKVKPYGRFCARMYVRWGGSNGQTSVFLCIILLSVMTLTGVLIDASRIATGKNHVRRAAQNAAMSVLADYNSRLKDEYGIFALGTDGTDDFSDSVRYYIEKNLTAGTDSAGTGNDTTKYLRLYDFRVEDVKVTPLFNLTENDAVKAQILEYMKYRAPKEIVEGVIERLSLMKKAAVMSEVYKRKTDIEKLLCKMDKYQEKLAKCINGSGKSGECFINEFDPRSRKNLAEDYADLYERYESMSEELEDIKEEISMLKMKQQEEKSKKDVGDAEDANEEDENDGIEDEIKALEEEKREISRNMDELKDRLNDTWNSLYHNGTKAFIKPNKEAMDCIEEIIRLKSSADAAIRELELYSEDNLDEADKISAEFKSTVENDIKRLKNLILSGEKAQEITSDINENISLLNRMISNLDYVKDMQKSSSIRELSNNDITEILANGSDEYNNQIEYDYEKPGKKEPAQDPRKGLSEKAKKLLNKEKPQDNDIIKAGIKMEELPSRKKISDAMLGEEDEKKSEYGNLTAGDINYGGNLQNVDEDIDFSDEDKVFSKNTFGFISSMGKILSEDLPLLRDNIYINEYIMGTFKNAVPALKEDETDKPDRDLAGMDKKLKDTFFMNEVEYILHGNSSGNMNRIMTESQLLLVRFALNTLHVYADMEKKELASTIAAAVAGWWTGGAGIPILSNLIMCSWGMGEAIIDVNDIMDGKSVPFYKQKGDWKLDIGLSKGGSKMDPVLSFTYHDYLRLFLLLKNTDKKIGRIEDLIELNMKKHKEGFKIGEYNTYVRVDAEVSIGYLFAPRFFTPPEKKTRDRRYIINVSVYEGY